MPVPEDAERLLLDSDLVHMVGIKGTGMAALAEILTDRGVKLLGSDIDETFFTDSLLKAAGVKYYEGFAAANVPPDAGLVVYSSAYDPSNHPELVEAADRGIPIITYTEALGVLSEAQPSVGISGVHGKTTTTGMVASIVQALGLEGTVLAGSALPDVGGRATLVLGQEFFVAETCEYRRNFLSFAAHAIVITSVEADHLDYFRDEADVASAFVEYGRRLPDGGAVIFCADDAGAASVAARLQKERPDLLAIAYGRAAHGPYRLADLKRRSGELAFSVGGEPYTLHVPGDHNMLNAAAAIAVVDWLVETQGIKRADDFRSTVIKAVGDFHGTARRVERIGEAGGVLVMDDYGHHPTAIATTLRGFRDFFPGRRIVLSFMSHTYSRTVSLRAELAESLMLADELILHDVYASAREEKPEGVDGSILADAVRGIGGSPHYIPGVMDALEPSLELLADGDLFVTMGAGNNWQLGRAVLERLQEAAR